VTDIKCTTCGGEMIRKNRLRLFGLSATERFDELRAFRHCLFLHAEYVSGSKDLCDWERGSLTNKKGTPGLRKPLMRSKPNNSQ